VLSREEAEELRQETHNLATRLAQHGTFDATWGSASAVSGGVKTQLKHCHDVQFHSAAFTRLISDERLVGPASQCIGSPNVQLHHTKMFIKPPEKGSPFRCIRTNPIFHTTTIR
jgi:ribulose-5-phosphate 4-epimerase/fuculose-1-phosphate aldolase